jgi:hypothetical protein
MRAYSALSPIDLIPQPPDTVHTILLTGGTGLSRDWESSASSAGAAAVGAHLVRFTGISTAGAALNFHVCMVSTHAVLPSSGSSITTGTTVGSTGNSLPVLGERTLQIPSWSTGWSAIARTSGYVMAEVWRK